MIPARPMRGEPRMSSPSADSPADRMFNALNNMIDFRVFGTPRERGDELEDEPGMHRDTVQVAAEWQDFLAALREWQTE